MDQPSSGEPEKKKQEDKIKKYITPFTFRGKPIVVTKTNGRPPGGLVRKGMDRGVYSEKKKMEVVGLYAAVGNLKKVSELTSVPEYYIKKWRKEAWFNMFLDEIRAENQDKIDAMFSDIIEKSLESIQDRVANGDYVMNFKGDLIRRPLPAKDLGYLAAINVDKRQVLRGEPTSRQEVIEKLPEKQLSRLEKLAETFENLAKHGRKPRVIENKVGISDADAFKTQEIVDAEEVRETTETSSS